MYRLVVADLLADKQHAVTAASASELLRKAKAHGIIRTFAPTMRTHAVGTVLVAGQMNIERDMVSVYLYEPSSTRESISDAVTDVAADWPTPFSVTFAERHEIQRLLRTVFQVEGDVVQGAEAGPPRWDRWLPRLMPRH